MMSSAQTLDFAFCLREVPWVASPSQAPKGRPPSSPFTPPQSACCRRILRQAVPQTCEPALAISRHFWAHLGRGRCATRGITPEEFGGPTRLGGCGWRRVRARHEMRGMEPVTREEPHRRVDDQPAKDLELAKRELNQAHLENRNFHSSRRPRPDRRPRPGAQPQAELCRPYGADDQRSGSFPLA